jgi:hypothetical protein
MRKTTARKTSARMAKKVGDLPPSTGKGDKIKGGTEWTYRDPASLATKAGGEVVSSDAYVKAR